ncbi:uncharacterized protein LOC132698376 [Cylas formicarius]|uniref:uncharacterized protein LOC132698376 n=1 Tax=Cylas formicarius TaxID=197179 RepID=UPI002958A57A|nr:uncharacterized protein LOC132698376 [Cylas formicarius]
MESPNKKKKSELNNMESSSIQSDSPVTVRTTTPEPNAILSAVSNSGGSDTESDYESDEGEEYNIDNLPRFQFKGITWKLFKPNDNETNTLYRILLEHPKSAKELAPQFAEKCKTQPNEALIILVKFCLDCADCQNLNLRKFGFPLDVKKIIKKVDNDQFPSKVFDTGKFLFSDTSVLAKVFQCAINTFIQTFTVAAHSNRFLYSEECKVFLKFLNLMCKAQYRHLWFTGQIISMKLLTGICCLKCYFEEKNSKGVFYNRLSGFINTLFLNFVNGSKPSDKHCAPLKKVALRELRSWINLFPQLFIEDFECVNIVAKYYLSSRIKSVRFWALEFCKKLVKDGGAMLSGEPIKTIIKIIECQLEDEHDQVVLAALDALAAINNEYAAESPKEGKHLRYLIKCIYYDNYEIAKRAGLYVAQFLKRESPTDDAAILIKLARMSTDLYPNLQPMFVEACLPSQPVLQNWNLIFDIFCNESYGNLTEKETISELALEAAQQILNGQSSKPRTLPRDDVKLTIMHHRKIAEKLLLSLKAILLLNASEAKILCNFLRILVKINPKVLTNDLCGHLEELFGLLKKLFAYLKDEQSLEAICDALLYCSEKVKQLNVPFKTGIADLTSQYSNDLILQLQASDHKVVDTAKKVSVLFSKFDLNEYLSWPTLHDSWGLMDSSEKFVDSLTACCHWSLVWNIRRLKSSSAATRNSHVEIIISNFQEFSASCFNVMANTGEVLQINIFRRICKSYLAFASEIDEITMGTALASLTRCIVDDPQILQLFLFVFEERIVGNERISSIEHGKIVADVINMTLLEILPPNKLSAILKYYYKYYDLYGKLIEKVMHHIKLSSHDHVLPMLVVSALSDIYQNILKKDGVVDIRRQSAKDLLNTSMRFADFGPMTSKQVLSKLLLFAITYAEYHKQYNFLIFLKPFATRISKFDHEKTEILDYIKTKVPNSDLKKDSILYFINQLKKSSAGKKHKNQKKK